MKITEFIKALEEIKEKHGNIEVETYTLDGRVTHRGPKLAFRRIVRVPFPRPDFWLSHKHDGSQRGAPVCRV
jgi:hypothetical protein